MQLDRQILAPLTPLSSAHAGSVPLREDTVQGELSHTGARTEQKLLVLHTFRADLKEWKQKQDTNKKPKFHNSQKGHLKTAADLPKRWHEIPTQKSEAT